MAKNLIAIILKMEIPFDKVTLAAHPVELSIPDIMVMIKHQAQLIGKVTIFLKQDYIYENAEIERKLEVIS